MVILNGAFDILVELKTQGISINNPFLIELEYIEVENNLLEIDFFDAIMKQNIV